MKSTISLTILLLFTASIFAQQVDIFQSDSSSEVEGGDGSSPSSQPIGLSLRAGASGFGGGGGGRSSAVVESPNS